MITMTAVDVERLLTLESLIPAIEAAHREHALGGASAPAPLMLSSASTDTHVLAMAASSAHLGRSVVKTMTDTPSNVTRGISTQRSTILLLDDAEGTPLALVDGVSVTRLRTAATSAVATSLLARAGARTLTLLGAGALAPLHARAICLVRDIDRITIWNRGRERAEALADALRRDGRDVRVAETPEAAVRDGDVICTLTPSADPVLAGRWLSPGQHLNVVGAPPRADHREVDGVAMSRSRVVVDSVANTMAKSGDALLALAEGAIHQESLTTELGEVAAGLKPGRRSADDITLFNSLGMGLQDLAATDLLYREATRDSSLPRLALRA